MDMMADLMNETIWAYAVTGLRIGFLAGSLLIAVAILRTLYHISPFHPLAKYPGPLLWRASRLPHSYHWIRGDLHKCLATFHSKYGPTVRHAPDELSFTAPEAWNQIYNARPQLPKTQFHYGNGSNLRLPTSMVMASDDEHMRLRRLVNPAFLNSGIAEVEPVLQQYTDLLCRQLAIVCKEGSQNVSEWYLWQTNDVICQLALDQEFKCLELKRMHPWPAFLLTVQKIGARINQFRRFGLSLSFFNLITPKKTAEAGQSFARLAREAIYERLRREEAGELAYKQRPDIVGLLLRETEGSDRLTKQEIVANSILVVGGGAETTATCLSATTYYLCKFPDVMQKLKDEVRGAFASPEEITLKTTLNLPYLKAVIDESLRIFPVASFIAPRRTPKGGHVIDGEVVPEGTYCSMGQWFIGRSELCFDEPMQFRPERWLNSEVQEVSGKRGEEILKPFGVGARNCIGRLLALAEAKLTMAKLIWNFDMELDGEQPTWVDDARFYVLWNLKPLKVKFASIR